MELSTAAMLIFVMALVFLLGWPLEWVPIVLIIVPILVPLLVSLNVNLTWFAILVAVNLQTAWLSPPVALSAYFLKGVVPEWDLKDIYLGMMQFMVIQVIGLILIFVVPRLCAVAAGLVVVGRRSTVPELCRIWQLTDTAAHQQRARSPLRAGLVALPGQIERKGDPPVYCVRRAEE